MSNYNTPLLPPQEMNLEIHSHRDFPFMICVSRPATPRRDGKVANSNGPVNIGYTAYIESSTLIIHVKTRETHR